MVPFEVISGIFCGVLAGLQAAHTATQDDGSPLSLVHRDVSPENVLVGADGVSRVLDFGVAKAAGMSSITKEGTVKGKLAYMAPEQLLGLPVTPCTDLFALSAVLWETLTGRRAFKGDNDGETVNRILHEPMVPPAEYRPEIPAALEAVILRGLQRDIGQRFQTAEEMQRALEEAVPPATSRRIAEWLKEVAKDSLAEKALKVSTMEGSAPAVVEAVIPVEQDRTELDLASSSLLRRPSQRWRYLTPLAVVLVASAAAIGAWALGRTHDPSSTPVAGATASAPAEATVSQPTSTRSAPVPTPAASVGEPTGRSALPRPTATPTKRVVPKPTSTSLYSRD